MTRIWETCECSGEEKVVMVMVVLGWCDENIGQGRRGDGKVKKIKK